jgi:uncharacterized coiled-coil DUF342 family protein
VDKLLR